MVLKVNHIFEASNEFSKQVNGFDFKPYVKNKQIMVLIYSTIFEKQIRNLASNGFKLQTMLQIKKKRSWGRLTRSG